MYMPNEFNRFYSPSRSREFLRPPPGRITEEAYNAGVDPNIDTMTDRYPVKPVVDAGVPQRSDPLPPTYQEPQIADDSPYGVYQSGKGRGQQDNPNQAPRPYNPYAGTGGPRPMASPNNAYFGGQGDVFGRPDYMYGSPQRSPYVPQQPYMPQQQPQKGGNPYQSRPPQQPMKGGARPNFQMGGGFNPYVGGGYQPQPQKGGSPYRNQGFGSGPVDPMRAMTDPRYRFQEPANNPSPGQLPLDRDFLNTLLPTGGVTPLPADFDASSQGVIGPGQQGDGSTLDASGLDFKTGSVSNNMMSPQSVPTGGATPPPLGFDPTVAPNIYPTQNYLSNDNVSPNKGGGSQRYNPYQGTGYNPNSGKGGSSY